MWMVSVTGKNREKLNDDLKAFTAARDGCIQIASCPPVPGDGGKKPHHNDPDCDHRPTGDAAQISGGAVFQLMLGFLNLDQFANGQQTDKRTDADQASESNQRKGSVGHVRLETKKWFAVL